MNLYSILYPRTGKELVLLCGLAALRSHAKHLRLASSRKIYEAPAGAVLYGGEYLNAEGKPYAVAFYCQPYQLVGLVRDLELYNVGRMVEVIDEPRAGQISRAMVPTGAIQ
jgi:hypothetical protein